jgi:hypothetical protein
MWTVGRVSNLSLVIRVTFSQEHMKWQAKERLAVQGCSCPLHSQTNSNLNDRVE